MRARDHGVRFVFGGAVTLMTGLIATRFGPGIGGLWLAFPAILPASLTLVKKHSGRTQARDECRGAVAGSTGLLAFGAVVWREAPRWPPAATLTVALLAWTGTSVSVWALVFGRRRG
jgi:hypothetical protein